MDSLLKQALFVPPIDETFNPNDTPMDGEEYLQHVMYERNNCPGIVTAKVKHKTFHNNLMDDNVKSSNDIKFASNTATKEWQEIQIKEFMEIQRKIQKIRENYSNNKEIHFPSTNESDEWIEYLKNNQPLLSNVLNLNQRTMEHILEIISEFLQENENIDLSSKDKWLSEWIYALIVCLKHPIEPFVHSILRDIARNFIVIRENLKENIDESKIIPLNLFICIISNNFDQLDLRDNFMLI